MQLKRKYQMGGPVAPAEPQDMGGQDPMQAIVEAFAAGLQNQDCNLLAQGAEMFLQLVQEAQSSGEGAPAEQPVFAKGGKLVGRKQGTLQLVRK